MYSLLFKNRFELFLISQLCILFGSLLFPIDFFERVLLPLLFLTNIIAGIILISRNKKLMWFFIILLGISSVAIGSSMLLQTNDDSPVLVRLVVFFVFQIFVTYQIIMQIWNAKSVNKKVIIGLMSGYISLGFLAFLLFLMIEILQPGSFKGDLLNTTSFDMKADSLMYYAYITLLTIGYGEIVPVTQVAQKAAVLTGLVGQFYLVIITAVVVEKYISHNSNKID